MPKKGVNRSAPAKGVNRSKSGPRFGVGGGLSHTVGGQAKTAGAFAPPKGNASTAPGAPPAPHVDPFFTSEDLLQISQFTTDLRTKMADIDRELADLGAQTTLDKTNNEKGAKESTAESTDSMISRGLFQSSVKDAALYDIEATRKLQETFLTDRLTRATLDAGTRKKILADSQTGFNTYMAGKQVDNARGVESTMPPPAAPAAPAAGSKPGTGAPAKPKTPSAARVADQAAKATAGTAASQAQQAAKSRKPKRLQPKASMSPGKVGPGAYKVR